MGRALLTYLERTAEELAPGPRLGVCAARLWARDVRQGGCPVGPLRHLFARAGVFGALWPVHNFLYWTAAHAQRQIDLGCPCCGEVSDDEAQMLAAMFAGSKDAARAALRDLVTPIALDGAVRLAMAAGRELTSERLERAQRPGT